MLLGQRIEFAHQTIEEFDDLLRRQVLRGGGEAGQIREQHRQVLDAVGNALLARLEPRRDRGRHHGRDQGFGALVLLLESDLGATHQRQGIEDKRRVDRDHAHHGVTGNQVAQPAVVWHQQPIDRREVQRKQQQSGGVDEDGERQLPVLDTEEEQCRAGKRVDDVESLLMPSIQITYILPGLIAR